MNYFSRLTDIVTCNLHEMLAREADPITAIRKIIGEMEEGLAGARRSVATATTNEERLGRELAELTSQANRLTDDARSYLRATDESAARLALVRKQEVADVMGGLQQQQKAARATREHLTTTLRALEARLNEARRQQLDLEARAKSEASSSPSKGPGGKRSSSHGTALEGAVLEDSTRSRQIESELEALKRELGQD